jgi:pilus assembly protein TadC
VVKITEAFSHRIKKSFPKLDEELKMAQMKQTPEKFIKQIFLLSLVLSLNISVLALLILIKFKYGLAVFPIFIVIFLLFFFLFLQVPKANIAKIRKDIESDIFVPSRMLLTLLESGSSIVTALERVAYTNAKSSKYFGKIASKIYLGKPLGEAIDEAIAYTPSESFRKVLQPVRKSLKTGTDIQKSLNGVLEDLVKEKAVEIERYEKRLGALSLFYMLFGVIIPAISVVLVVILLSVVGLKVEFFPFLLLLLIITLLIQVVFIKSFQSIRPLIR